MTDSEIQVVNRPGTQVWLRPDRLSGSVSHTSHESPGSAREWQPGPVTVTAPRLRLVGPVAGGRPGTRGSPGPAPGRRRSPSGPASDQYQPEPRLNLPGPAPCHGDSVGPVTSRRPGSVTDSMTPPPRRPARGSPGPRPAARAAWRRDSKSNIPSDNLAMPRSQ